MTTTSKTAFVDRSVYLGDPSKGDPAPVFRDEASDGVRLPDGVLVAWPEGAVFAVYFASERFPLAVKFAAGSVVGGCEFFDANGWPLELASALKASLGEEMKSELQVYPWGWRTFCEDSWRQAHYAPRRFRRSRLQSAIVHGLAPFVPAPPEVAQ